MVVDDCNSILRRSLLEIRRRKCAQLQFEIARSPRLARTQVAGRVLQDGGGNDGGDAPIVVIGSDTIVDVRLIDTRGLRCRSFVVFISNQTYTRVARGTHRLLYVRQGSHGN